MQLQLSCDLLSWEKTVSIVESVYEHIDIIELGTPFVLKYGMKAVEKFKREFPNKCILADIKIMDAGYEEAKLAFTSGADIVTVLGVAPLFTVQQANACAKEYGKEIMVDMMEVQDLVERASMIEQYDIAYLCVHTARDRQPYGDLLGDLHTLKQTVKKARIAVAGGINLYNIDRVIQEEPDIVIVGAGLTKAEDPGYVAKMMKERMRILGKQG